jgi:predicted TIM-barrel fold metal-dependent hydrolase
MTMLGGRPVTAPGWTGEPRQEVAIVDCDIHHSVSKNEELLPYLPRVYRERVTDQGFLLPGSGYFNVPKRAARTDLADGCDANMPTPGVRGSDYQVLKEQQLDLWNVDVAILTGGNMYSAGVIPDPDYAAALCSAWNDWSLENWIAKDSRFRMTMAIATSDPRLAVKEIDRIGDNPAIAGVQLGTGTRLPYGNRFYHPIWEACERHGLAVSVHPGAEGAGMAGPPTGVGYPTYYLETRLARPQMAMAHATSLICEGVFERFPHLKFAFVEVDQFWVAGLMWHLDADWKSLREQTPWVRKLPSEYFRQHIRIGSQPLEEPEKPEHLLVMLDAMHADETLIYCSDWPHWDWDDPATTFPKLPERLHRRIFAENARGTFRV